MFVVSYYQPAFMRVFLLLIGCMTTDGSDDRNLLKHVYPARIDDNSNHVFIGFISSFGGDFNSSADVTGVRAAIDRINNDTAILENYTLHYVLSDSQCDRAMALRALFEQLMAPPTKLALIGAGCSSATQLTAEVSHFYNLAQLSCSSASPGLANRKLYPRYFQLLHSTTVLSHAYLGIMKEFGWRQAVFILQEDSSFSSLIDETKQLFELKNITYSVYTFDTEKGTSGMDQNIFGDSRERIFIITTNESNAADILCEAYQRGLKYPTHLFITFQFYSPQWWHREVYNTTCTGWQLEEVLNNSLAINVFKSMSVLEERTTMGISGTEFLHEISKLSQVYGYGLSTPYCFDAMWTLAYALNNTLIDIAANSTLNDLLNEGNEHFSDEFKLNQFVYSNDLLQEVIFNHLNQTFIGLTGQVNFDANGIRKANRLNLFQFRSAGSDMGNLVWTHVASFVLNGSANRYSFAYQRNETVETVWPDGVPYDGVAQRTVTTVFLPITIVFSLLATLGLCFAMGCLLFNCIFRNRKLVRLTSPKLNYLIICGAILLYLDVYFVVFPATKPVVVDVLTKITTWLTGIGYTLCFGTILAKLIRVWFIFNNPKPNEKMAIKDWILAVGVLLLTCLDILVLTIYISIEETSQESLAHVKLIQSKERQPEMRDDYTIEYYVYVHTSKFQDVVIGLYNGYKVIMQVIALLLAFLTRKVKVKGLDDSKYIAAIVYITSIVLGILIVSEYTLNEFVDAYGVIFSLGIITDGTCILGLVFIPKMVGLYKDPSGESIFHKHTSETPSDRVSKETTNELENLKKKVIQLEALLSVQDNERLAMSEL